MTEDTHHGEASTSEPLQAVLLGLSDGTWQLRLRDETIEVQMDLEIVPIGEAPIPRSVRSEGDLTVVHLIPDFGPRQVAFLRDGVVVARAVIGEAEDGRTVVLAAEGIEIRRKPYRPSLSSGYQKLE